MKTHPFDRKEHIYKNDAFVELVKDAIRFFSGTPVHVLPPPERFTGSGVYALYYTGNNPLYSKYDILNRLAYNYPIYVGKAVPRGWRQARVSDNPTSQSAELYTRLREHSRNISAADTLNIKDFACRFVIFESEGSDMIGTIEAALIKTFKPLWNIALDGFGNHTPGIGRFEQAKSDWDVIHPGRRWAERCKGPANNREHILRNIDNHLSKLK